MVAFLADANPEADREIVLAARENLRKIGAQRTVLISSVNVYDDSRGKDENSEMPTEGLGAYGTYRLELENWVQEDFDDVLIVRLPALYGPGLRKNFIHDLIDPVSPFLSVAIYGELASASMLVARSYEVGEDGFQLLVGGLQVDLGGLFQFGAENGDALGGLRPYRQLRYMSALRVLPGQTSSTNRFSTMT